MIAYARAAAVAVAAAAAVAAPAPPAPAPASAPPASAPARVPDETFTLRAGGPPYTTKGGITFALKMGGEHMGAKESAADFVLDFSGPEGGGKLELLGHASGHEDEWYGEGVASGRLFRMLGRGPAGVAMAVYAGPVPARPDDDTLVARVFENVRAAGYTVGGGRGWSVGDHRVAWSMRKGMTVVVSGSAGSITGDVLYAARAPLPSSRAAVERLLVEEGKPARTKSGLVFTLKLTVHKDPAPGGPSMGIYELRWSGPGGAGVMKLAVSDDAYDWYREGVAAGRLFRLLGTDRDGRLRLVFYGGAAPKKRGADGLVERALVTLADLDYPGSSSRSYGEEEGRVSLALTGARLLVIIGPRTGDLLYVGPMVPAGE
jgi:hypothetical protein